jgi:two-component system chemotaxis response regulator CheY
MFPKNARILVVDDFTTMRKIIKKVLLDLGFTDVWEADDGTSALPLIQKADMIRQPFEFIICDWDMPKMQGIDFLKYCRADERFKNVPFILITADSEKNLILSAAQLGVSDYLVKPFNTNTLKAKMEKVWAKYHPETDQKTDEENDPYGKAS